MSKDWRCEEVVNGRNHRRNIYQYKKLNYKEEIVNSNDKESIKTNIWSTLLCDVECWRISKIIHRKNRDQAQLVFEPNPHHAHINHCNLTKSSCSLHYMYIAIYLRFIFAAGPV